MPQSSIPPFTSLIFTADLRYVQPTIGPMPSYTSEHDGKPFRRGRGQKTHTAAGSASVGDTEMMRAQCGC